MKDGKKQQYEMELPINPLFNVHEKYKEVILINPYRFASDDPDATAFLTAAGITDATITSAINTLVAALKTAGIWTKCNAIYPIVGGTATTHKYNLKDPRDLDAAYRLSFAGTITHASTGMTGNGSTGYANTKLIPSSVLQLDNSHIGFYSRTNSDGVYCDIGCYGENIRTIEIFIKLSNKCYFRVNEGQNVSNIVATDSLGFRLANRLSSTSTRNLINNSINVCNVVSTGLSDNSIFILARQDYTNNPIYYSPRECAFSSIGQGLTDTELGNFYTAVQAFQTTLSRNI
jgi:hypothetical protein